MRNSIIIAATVSLLGGCAQSLDKPLDTPLSENFGKAVASMDAQIIPAEVSDLPPADTGARGAAAVARYEKDQVKQPVIASTSTVGGSSGYKGQ